MASFPITAYHTWADSITEPCWLANRREWTTFVRNRVKIIGEFPIVGKDGVTRGYKILTGCGYVIERPQQLVCDLEISGVRNTINNQLLQY